LGAETSVNSAIDLVKDHHVISGPNGVALDAWPVAAGRELLGMVQDSQLKQAVSNGNAGKTLAELGDPGFLHHRPEAKDFPHVHPDHLLSLALERMGTTKLRVLPVVSRANVRQLLGIVVLEDVLEAYGVGRPSAAQGYNE
jgi:hypothetical protein